MVVRQLAKNKLHLMGVQMYGTEPVDYSYLSGHRDSSKMAGVPIHKGLISVLCIPVTDGYSSAIR